MTPLLWQKAKSNLKSLLMKVKEESEKAGWKHSKSKDRHQVPSLHGKQMGKQCETLFFGAPKSLQIVTTAMKLKDTLLLGRKAVTNLDSMFKSRDITLLRMVCLLKAVVFPEVLFGCESWTIKKGEHQRTDAFELWSWRRLLRICWTARRSNQSILKEIISECSLEGLMLNLKLQYFGHLMWKTPLIGKDPDAGKDWRQEEKGMTEDEMVGWHQWVDRHDVEQAPGVGDGQGSLAWCSPWGSQRVRRYWTTEQNWIWQCRRHKRYGFSPWFGKIPWWRPWQPTPVFLPGESHGQRTLVGCRQSCKESDMTEVT